MKKKIWIPIVVVVVLLAVLFVPIPQESYDDGGTREWISLTYKIVDWNRISNNGTYEKTRIYWGKDKNKTIDELWEMECEKIEHSFIATVLEINGNSVLVEPVAGEEELNSSDQISFAISGEGTPPSVGNVIKVTYTGGIMESYPAKINIVKWEFCDSLTKEQVVSLFKSKGEEYVLEQLKDYTNTQLLEMWGDAGNLSGFWGNVWKINEMQNLIVYYDNDGFVEHIKVDGLDENKNPVQKDVTYNADIPKLNVLYADISYEAMKGTLTWTYDKGDGTFEGVNADSMHPTAAMEHMPKIEFYIGPVSRIDPYIAYLKFDMPPTDVSVQAWHISEENGSPAAESVGLDLLPYDGEEGDPQYKLKLLDKPHIYEITARWNGENGTGGTVRYCFRTVKNPVME